jgi:hypothetical protein
VVKDVSKLIYFGYVTNLEGEINGEDKRTHGK